MRLYKPNVIGFMEPKIDKSRLDYIRCTLGFKHGLVVERVGLSGGMVLWRREEVEIQILNFSRYHIDAYVEGTINSRITLFYGSPSSNLRRHS